MYKSTVPANWSLEIGCVPCVTAAVMIQPLALHVSGTVSVTCGFTSLQLWTSSLPVAAAAALAPIKMSAEKALSLLPPLTCLARSGVHDVAILFETLSIVWLALALVFGWYHAG